jgi:putative exosortase-associated protein (TIGR04073 family)
MRNTYSLLVAVVVIGTLATGCTHMQNKLGRGFSNTFEIVRMGEMRRTMEQTALFDSPEVAYSGGFVRGLSRTLTRTGLGVVEIATFPLPPYGPMFTSYLSPQPVYPDNFKPGLVADSMYDTDTLVGFGGGDVAPKIPGSRFAVFGMH